MKNLPIIMKFLSILSLFGVFTVAVAVFAGTQMQRIDDDYSDLMSHKDSAALWLSRASRNIEATMGSVAELTIARTENDNRDGLQSYNDAASKFFDRMDKAIAAQPNRLVLKELKQNAQAAISKCQHVVEVASSATTPEEALASQDLYRSNCRPDMDNAANAIVAEVEMIGKEVQTDGDELTSVTESARTITIGSVLGGLVVVLLGSFFAIRSWIVSPINGLSSVMGVIAGGNFGAEVAGKERKDEIGSMARAVEVFRDNGLKALTLEKEAEEARSMSEAERARQADLDRKRASEMSDATDSLGAALKRVAEGDLTVHISNTFASEFEGLRQDFNSAVSQLQQTLQGVVQAAETIDAGSRELSGSANDLSKRTEQQAAALEETAAALDEITANVGNSNKLAQDARSVAANANKAARESGQVVASAVEAMHRIEQSSSQISNIIGVIDEIAFQTNLLALNAGVEAARAGDAGKGFAVVAQEVRELAQRSAQAAKEIKDLIGKSSSEVEGGVKLVRATGEALKTIETYVSTVNDHMESIAASAQEQATGLAQVNSAVNQMDQTTQQNAAMVEESTAASGSLAQEADRLRGMMQRFRLGAAQQSQHSGAYQATASRTNGAPHSAQAAATPVQSPARRMMGKVAKAFGVNAAAASASEPTSWEEF